MIQMNGLSRLMILEPPKAGAIYHMGTDPIPFGDKKEVSLDSEERSKQCSVIIKEDPENPLGPYPVAYYLARTNNADYVFNETILLQRYYNNCLNNIERNASSTFIKCYQDAGVLNMAARYPFTALIANWQVLKVPKEKRMHHGWNNDSSTKGAAIKLLADWIPYGIQKTYSDEILEDIQNLGITNTDIAIALISAIMQWKHTQTLLKHRDAPREVIAREVYVMENGRAVRKVLNIGMSGGHHGIDGPISGFGRTGSHYGINNL